MQISAPVLIHAQIRTCHGFTNTLTRQGHIAISDKIFSNDINLKAITKSNEKGAQKDGLLLPA